MEMPTVQTRTLVLLREDVAPANWHRPYAELLAAAEAKETGIKTMVQPMAGTQDKYWDLNVPIPSGWAAFRQGDYGDTRAFLYIQKY